MSDETYNGWTNRETWAAALWLGDEEDWYAHALTVARNAVDDINQEYADEAEDRRQRLATFRAAQGLQGIVDAWRDNVYAGSATRPERGAVHDIGSAWRVEWDEIAAHYVDTVHEERA